MLKFDAKAFLINRLVKAAPLILVNFKACTNDRIAFVLEDQIGYEFFWRYFACLVDDQNFKVLMSSTCVVCRARNNATMMARPTATSAAATVIMKKTKTCAL